MEAERRDELTALLMLVFIASATQHGMSDQNATAAAQVCSRQRAARMASAYVNHSKARLLLRQRRWNEIIDGIGLITLTSIELRERLPKGEVSAEVGEVFDNERDDAMGSTETTEAATSGGEAAVKSQGIDSEDDTWFTADDQRVCPICGPLHGTKRSVWSAKFPEGPTAHPRCILPESIVSVPGVIAATKSFYDGRCVEVCLRSGRRLADTENHPVLTSSGWLPAILIAPGNRVFGTSPGEWVSHLVDPHDHNIPSTAEQVFHSLKEASSVPPMRVPSAPVQFHGDGASIKGEVEIVDVHGLLRCERDLSQKRGEFHFQRRRDGTGSLAGVGETASTVPRNRCASRRSMSRFQQLPPVCGSCRTPTISHDVRPVSDANSTFEELSPYCRTTHATPPRQFKLRDTADVKVSDLLGPQGTVGPQLLNLRSSTDATFDQLLSQQLALDSKLARKFLHRFAGKVTLDDVVEVREFDICGHVYDFQCPEYELFTADGVIVHNCRCWLVYANVEEVEFAGV